MITPVFPQKVYLGKHAGLCSRIRVSLRRRSGRRRSQRLVCLSCLSVCRVYYVCRNCLSIRLSLIGGLSHEFGLAGVTFPKDYEAKGWFFCRVCLSCLSCLSEVSVFPFVIDWLSVPRVRVRRRRRSGRLRSQR